MEEEPSNKLRITFTIDVPEMISESDFNTLVLRMNNLRYTKENIKTVIDKENHNRNIEEMKKLLDNFIIKTFEEV